MPSPCTHVAEDLPEMRKFATAAIANQKLGRRKFILTAGEIGKGTRTSRMAFKASGAGGLRYFWYPPRVCLKTKLPEQEQRTGGWL